MNPQDLAALRDFITAIDEVCAGIGEARDAIGIAPTSHDDVSRYDAPKRIASRALLKGVEQLQDLIARALRLILTIEQEDLTGLSARGIADKAESLGLIGSSDRWSALVKLRNQLVHEYPLSKEQRFQRLSDAWNSLSALWSVTSTITDFLHENGYPRDVID